MKCRKCGSEIVLKTTNFRHNDHGGVHSWFWQCPVCGWEHIEERCSCVLEPVVLKG